MPQKVDAYIGLGSNIDPETNILRTVELLQGSPERHCEVINVSTFYRCPAVGPAKGQSDFINGIVHIRTELTAEQLKYDFLRPLEFELGRALNEEKYTPRCMDLDIIFYADEIHQTSRLKIPAQDLYERNFVYIPLLEISPSIIDPRSRKAVSEAIPSLDHQMQSFELPSQDFAQISLSL